MFAQLGFGLMRLPKKDEKIILSETAKMVDMFLERGGTYFDTAYVYEGSEEIVKKAITERHSRDSYTMASKMASWKVTDTFTAEDMFNEQLRRTGLEYFDYYLIHSLQDGRYEESVEKGCWDYARKMKEEGKIRHLGFSFHGTPKLLERILKEQSDVEFVQLQINYLDWDNPMIESGKTYEIARRHNKDIVIMEPIKGGLLATVGKGILEEGTAAPLALRFAATLDGVITVLSGMSTIEQVEDNLNTFTDMEALSDDERKKLQDVVEAIRNENRIECTSCRYCTKDCPKQIDIPDIFGALNDIRAFGDHNRPHFFYNGLVNNGKTNRASECIKCEKCKRVCPQHLDIPTLIGEASGYLDKQ